MLLTYTPRKPAFCVEQAIEEYVAVLPITEGLKAMIADRDFMKTNPAYYLDYPYLFSAVFEAEEELLLLSIAGFFYYKSVIFLDHALDEAVLLPQNFVVINICQEECIKILSRLYANKPTIFWSLWYKRKLEYMRAYEIDSNKSIQSMDDYEDFVDYKASIGKIAIDCLFTLSKTDKEKEYHNLLVSHRYFYTAFQIMDDIVDFRHDINVDQFNVANWTLNQKIGNSEGYAQLSIEDKTKYLYLSGTVNALLDKAINYLAKASEVVKDYPLDYWKTEIIKLHNNAISQKLNIYAYIKSLTVKSSLSKQFVANRSVNESIKSAIEFVNNAQNKDGSWEEICNNAGLSDTWATAFIASFLAEIPIINLDCIGKAIVFLSQHKRNEQWGYNKAWISDNDSSTFALIAQTLQGVNCEYEFNRWLLMQNTDGGFSTYPNITALLSSLRKEEADSVRGWTQSHLCVSAAALYLMSLRDVKGDALQWLLQFILCKQRSDFLWDAYWWTHPIYSTYFIIKANNKFHHAQLQEATNKATNMLMQLQNSDGSFGNADEKVFYTGLVVDALCNKDNVGCLSLARAVNWLCRRQYVDGSWDASHPMKIPAIDIINPHTITTWNIAPRGINVRAEEYNRLFSTVVALKALISYAGITGK